MATKFHWHKMHSDRYLADREYNQLSLAEHGTMNIIHNILRTQTDIPGVYIICGRPGTRDELAKHVLRHANRSRARGVLYVNCVVTVLVLRHILEVDSVGIISSPYICKEVAQSKIGQIRGRLGGNPGLTPDEIQVNPPLNLEKRREEKRREVTTSSVSCGENSPIGEGEDAPARRSGGAPRHIGETVRKLLRWSK